MQVDALSKLSVGRRRAMPAVRSKDVRMTTSRQALPWLAGAADPRRRWLLPILVFLSALVWQSFVIQTHIHPLQGQGGGGITCESGARSCADPSPDTADHHAYCELCLELDEAGQFLASVPPGFWVPISAMALAHVSTAAGWKRNERSHAWYSRGPPLIS
jgi:hypothetical protein